jgi:D-glycero-D-manno-heptose 1,7-bisphosphate phosphatase
MVGDRCSDVAAANAAGLRQAFLISGTEGKGCTGDYLPVNSLAEVERWLEERAPRRSLSGEVAHGENDG